MAPLRLFCIAQLKFTVAMISITSYMAPPLLVERVSFFYQTTGSKAVYNFIHVQLPLYWSYDINRYNYFKFIWITVCRNQYICLANSFKPCNEITSYMALLRLICTWQTWVYPGARPKYSLAISLLLSADPQVGTLCLNQFLLN